MVEEHAPVESAASIGLVKAVKVLTLEEAQKLKDNKQTSPKMMYFGVSPTYTDALKPIVYASINLAPNVIDENGDVWPYWLTELSGTRTPRLRYEQTPSTDLEPIQLSAHYTKAEPLKLSAFYVGDLMDPEMKQLSDDLAARTAQLEQANARIAELEATLKDIEDAKTKAEADAAVAALEVSDEVAVKLSAIYVTDRELFQMAAEAFKASKVVKTVEHAETPTAETPSFVMSARNGSVGEPVSVASESERARLAYMLLDQHNAANPEAKIDFQTALKRI
jgi:hypothetical protein